MTPEREDAFHAGLRAAAEAGRSVLMAGGSAMDAVTQTVMALENDPLFNAGRGAVYTSDRRHEMDAAVMSGVDRACGAVANICGPKHPVLAARAVMEQSEHVFLVGEGALTFCKRIGLEFVDPSWFGTAARLEALEVELARRSSGAPDDGDEARRHGTVGAVALDCHGHLAAATSTGGMTAKMPGRIGDSPVFGAGTWADDATCAISATGHGEFFIRMAVAHEIAARMKLGGQSLQRAAEDVVSEVGVLGGSGGLVAVDAAGNIALPRNCSGMYRAALGGDGAIETAVFDEIRRY